MNATQDRGVTGFWHEAKLIFGYAREVWRMVPNSHKLAFGGAALLMALVSACNIAFPLLLGQLLDRIKTGDDEGFDATHLTQIAAVFLFLIAGAFLLREGLQVFRRYLVENS